MIKFHPACFSEIFFERTVNNIYFDTFGFQNYYDNVEGSRERLKVRIRWYGNLFGNISSPVLEHKIKKGLLGKKDSFLLGDFLLDKNFHKSTIEGAAKGAKLPPNVKDELLTLHPALLNSYVRRYFLSADKKFRVTVDRQLSYYRISYGQNTFLNSFTNHSGTVLELKYDAEFEPEAKEVATLFPFMMTKNSKYLSGIENLFL
jgi:SPX domain protein involved in polyphosphate accumulation